MSWIEFTPNTDFDGWSEYSWPPGSPGPLVCPSGLWSVDPDVGSLYCSGAEGHTALLCDRVFADFRFHIEYRFAPQPETDEPRLNSGVYLRMDPPQHVMHQIETRGNNAGFLIGGSVREGRETLIRSLRPGADGWVEGATHRPRDWGPLVSEPDTRPREMCRPDGSDLGEPAPVRIHPSGEWNTYDVEAVGTRITIWTNGVLSCYTDQCDVPSGRIGVEAEYWPIEFRDFRVTDM